MSTNTTYPVAIAKKSSWNFSWISRMRILESTTHRLLILQMIGNRMSDGSLQSIVESTSQLTG